VGLWCVLSCFVLAPEGAAQCVTSLLVHIYIYVKRGLIWIVYIAPLASLASLARSLRSPNDRSTVWDLLESERPYKTNQKQQVQSPDVPPPLHPHSLLIDRPFGPLGTASWGHLGPYKHHLGSSCTVLYRLGAILGSLDAVLNASRLAKTFPRSFHKASPRH
jgi:hypothetical protein